MYIRLEFEELDTDLKMETHCTLTGSPSGTCLTSLNSRQLTTQEMHEKNKNVNVWYLDEHILNRHYFGVESALDHIREMPGVKSPDMQVAT